MLHSPSHPGGLLSEELETLGITISQAAKDLGVSRQILSAIINERRPITAEMAVRIGHYIGNGPGLWLRMQAQYDLWKAEQKMKTTLKSIPKVHAAA
jgi:addiction module HigA family antidote